jgi:hypothetical protein
MTVSPRLNFNMNFDVVVVVTIVRQQKQVSCNNHVHISLEDLGFALQHTPVYPLLAVYQFCTGLLAAVTLDCDKHFGLVNVGQRRLEGNTTGGIERQVSRFVIASIIGPEYRNCVYREGKELKGEICLCSRYEWHRGSRCLALLILNLGVFLNVTHSVILNV